MARQSLTNRIHAMNFGSKFFSNKDYVSKSKRPQKGITFLLLVISIFYLYLILFLFAFLVISIVKARETRQLV